MKISIEIKSSPDTIVREIPTPPTPTDLRPFAVRNRELLDRVARHKRKKFVAIDGGRSADPSA